MTRKGLSNLSIFLYNKSLQQRQGQFLALHLPGSVWPDPKRGLPGIRGAFEEGECELSGDLTEAEILRRLGAPVSLFCRHWASLCPGRRKKLRPQITIKSQGSDSPQRSRIAMRRASAPSSQVWASPVDHGRGKSLSQQYREDLGPEDAAGVSVRTQLTITMVIPGGFVPFSFSFQCDSQQKLDKENRWSCAHLGVEFLFHCVVWSFHVLCFFCPLSSVLDSNVDMLSFNPSGSGFSKRWYLALFASVSLSMRKSLRACLHHCVAHIECKKRLWSVSLSPHPSYLFNPIRLTFTNRY